MKKVAFSVMIFFALMGLQAQSSVTYDLEPGLEQIMDWNKKVWQKVEQIGGYRIQITTFSGTNSLARAEKAKAEFENSFSEYPAYISYLEPYFRLRIGDFRSKLEAYEALRKVSLQYEGAFIIKDEINFKGE